MCNKCIVNLQHFPRRRAALPFLPENGQNLVLRPKISIIRPFELTFPLCDIIILHAMKTLDLGSPNILRTSLRLAVPAMVAQFINVLYSIVDRIFVGNMAEIGDLALAGVGVCAPVTTLITSFASLVGIGGAPIFAMSMGEGRPDNARKILSNALLMLVIIAACLTAVILPLLKPLLMTFGASENTYPFAREYMLVYASGCIFAVISAGLNQFITAQGYSGIAMATTCIGAIANVGLDPLFIFTLDMGVTGAAAATVLSQGLSSLFVITFLLMPKTKVRLSVGGYSGKTMLRIVKMGLSPFFITATDSVIIIVLNAVVQKYGGADGDMWVTVATIVQAFLTLITMPMLGITTGTQPVLSYNYGARNSALIKKAEKIIVLMCLTFTTVMFALSWAIEKPFVSLFTDDPVIAQNSVSGIRKYMIGIIPLALQYAFVDGLTALGQPRFAFTLSITRKLVLLLSLTFALPAIFGVSAVFYAEPAADIASAILSTTTFALVINKILKKREQSDSGIL